MIDEPRAYRQLSAQFPQKIKGSQTNVSPLTAGGTLTDSKRQFIYDLIHPECIFGLVLV